VNRNEQEWFTILVTVTASGEKLPLSVISKGKTKKLEQSMLGSDP
jgi:Holliday junction resolvasome RuvABC DNA-binding subunit